VTGERSKPQIGHLLRDLGPQVLAALARRHKDFAAAEDAVQEALIAAATQWPESGIPANPNGWLYRVAWRRLTDEMRSDIARRRREGLVASMLPQEEAFTPPPDADLLPGGDDTLLLLFMCCHRALTQPSAIALTLRAVGGLTTAEIARAFMVQEATMAQRISRAKQGVKGSNVPFSMPTEAERSERLTLVLHVLYLIFSEGYASSFGADLQRPDLANEAIRLARAIHSSLPEHPEVIGLLALLLLTDARRDARTGPLGELIPLDEQDRGLWRAELIEEGVALLSKGLGMGRVGPYQIQAAIAALHDEAQHAEDTDWPQIRALYTVLRGISGNPMVALNQAVAAAMVDGPPAGLRELKKLDEDPHLKGHYRLDAVRAHLLERAGELEDAIRHYLAAADRTTSIPERRYLEAKAARLRAKLQQSTAPSEGL
jgi:RNA polymerase sigma factor (sigma-70 family)